LQVKTNNQNHYLLLSNFTFNKSSEPSIIE
jgi:hypothetical protein